MPDNDPRNLNVRAYIALDGATLDWRRDMAELMRSDVPLERNLREKLAAAFENETQEGPRLDLKNHKTRRDRFASIAARYAWMEIGRSITALIEANVTVSSAIQLIADRAGASTEKCEAALKYFRMTDKWVIRGLQSDAGQVLGRQMLEGLHHSTYKNEGMRRVNAKLLDQLGLSH